MSGKASVLVRTTASEAAVEPKLFTQAIVRGGEGSPAFASPGWSAPGLSVLVVGLVYCSLCLQRAGVVCDGKMGLCRGSCRARVDSSAHRRAFGPSGRASCPRRVAARALGEVVLGKLGLAEQIGQKTFVGFDRDTADQVASARGVSLKRMVGLGLRAEGLSRRLEGVVAPGPGRGKPELHDVSRHRIASWLAPPLPPSFDYDVAGFTDVHNIGLPPLEC